MHTYTYKLLTSLQCLVFQRTSAGLIVEFILPVDTSQHLSYIHTNTSYYFVKRAFVLDNTYSNSLALQTDWISWLSALQSEYPHHSSYKHRTYTYIHTYIHTYIQCIHMNTKECIDSPMPRMVAECPLNLCILRNAQAAEVTVDLP